MESQPRLLDQMREVLRLKHLSFRTEEAYIGWVKRFILFHDKRHPKDMGAAEIRAFLAYLATHEHVAASTQNGALNALLFLYRSVLQQPFPHLEDIERAKRPRRLPTVFTRNEVHAILTRLTGMPHLMAGLLYGAGLRLMECVRLRVKDVDFTYYQITVRDGKGPRTGSPCSPGRWQSPCSDILPGCSSSTKKIASQDTGRCTCHTPLIVKTPVLVHPGSGSMSFPPPNAPSIREPVSSADTMCRKQCYKEP
jgi:hypothetical protein